MSTYKGHLEDSSGNLMLPVSPDVAPIETSNRASQSYAVGDFLYYNHTLYKVTSAISSGGTISPGSNCTATTVGAELKNSSSGNIQVASGVTSSANQTVNTGLPEIKVLIVGNGNSGNTCTWTRGYSGTTYTSLIKSVSTSSFVSGSTATVCWMAIYYS